MTLKTLYLFLLSPQVKLIFGSLVWLLMVGMLNFVWNKKFLVEFKGLVRR